MVRGEMEDINRIEIFEINGLSNPIIDVVFQSCVCEQEIETILMIGVAMILFDVRLCNNKNIMPLL